MKHIIFSLLVLTGLSVKAQDFKEDLKGKTSFSVKAGWLQSKLKGDDVKDLAIDGKIDHRNAFFVGVSVDNSIGTYFGLKHELYYQNYGAKFKRELEDHTFDATLEMHSLRLNPISPTFKVGGLQVYAGPYINMLLYSSITAVDEEGKTYKDHGIFGSTEDDQEDSKYLQKMDYGVTVGIEYQFKFGMVLGIKYTKGFASIFDNANTFGVDKNKGMKDIKIYNQTFGLYLGYRF